MLLISCELRSVWHCALSFVDNSVIFMDSLKRAVADSVCDSCRSGDGFSITSGGTFVSGTTLDS